MARDFFEVRTVSLMNVGEPPSLSRWRKAIANDDVHSFEETEHDGVVALVLFDGSRLFVAGDYEQMMEIIPAAPAPDADAFSEVKK